MARRSVVVVISKKKLKKCKNWTKRRLFSPVYCLDDLNCPLTWLHTVCWWWGWNLMMTFISPTHRTPPTALCHPSSFFLRHLHLTSTSIHSQSFIPASAFLTYVITFSTNRSLVLKSEAGVSYLPALPSDPPPFTSHSIISFLCPPPTLSSICPSCPPLSSLLSITHAPLCSLLRPVMLIVYYPYGRQLLHISYAHMTVTHRGSYLLLVLLGLVIFLPYVA